MVQNELLNDYAWIISGSQRIKVVKVLTNPKTPKMISKDTGLKFSNVSDCLRLMAKKKLVLCLNPKSHLGRLYELTPVGKKIQEKI